MADGSHEIVRPVRNSKAGGGRFGEAEGDMRKVAERHAAAIAKSGAIPAPVPASRPWVERLGRHFLLGRGRTKE